MNQLQQTQITQWTNHNKHKLPNGPIRPRSKLSRTSLKYWKVISKVTFSLALPSWLLKLPFWVHNGTAKKKWEQPKSFALEIGQLRLSFVPISIWTNWRHEHAARLLSAIQNGGVRWWIFLLLWRGISLGSDALRKLKQRSVTQLSVVCLLVSTKNIRFLEWPPLILPANLAQESKSLVYVLYV